MSGAVHVTLQWYRQYSPRADDCANVVSMDGERRRSVAALVHSDERNGRGAGARKGNSDDLPDTILATSLLFVLRFMGGLILAYVESIFSSVVAQGGGT